MTVQGPVKKQQPDGMSHRGQPPPPLISVAGMRSTGDSGGFLSQRPNDATPKLPGQTVLRGADCSKASVKALGAADSVWGGGLDGLIGRKAATRVGAGVARGSARPPPPQSGPSGWQIQVTAALVSPAQGTLGPRRLP